MQANEHTDYEFIVDLPIDHADKLHGVRQWLDDNCTAEYVIAKMPRHIVATHPPTFASTRHFVGFRATITLMNRDDALLFKLTWGGEI